MRRFGWGGLASARSSVRPMTTGAAGSNVGWDRCDPMGSPSRNEGPLQAWREKPGLQRWRPQPALPRSALRSEPADDGNQPIDLVEGVVEGQRRAHGGLHADRGLYYGDVVKIMAAVKQAGVDKLAMVTDPLE